jgi:hypothetical protein
MIWELSLLSSITSKSGIHMKLIITILVFAYLSTFALETVPAAVRVQADGETIYLPMVINYGPSSNIVINGDFEAGRSGWVEYEDSAFFDFPLIVRDNEMPPPIRPYDGSWAGWLGGDSGLISYIEQDITIPSFGPNLDYWHWIDSIWACDSSYGGVYINATLVDQYLLCSSTDTGGWVKRTINLSAYSGQTVKLRIYSQTGVTNYSSLYIDAVSIQRSP